MRIFAARAVHLRLRSNTHFQLGCPRLDLALLVQLSPSRKHTIPLPHRQTPRHPRLANHSYAS